MNIVYTTGCTCDGIVVDDRPFEDLTKEEKQKLVSDLILHAKEETLQDILITFLELDGEYKYLYTCEQCGDSVSEYSFAM